MFQELLYRYFPNIFYCLKNGVIHDDWNFVCKAYSGVSGVRFTPSITYNNGYITINSVNSDTSYGGGGSVFINNLIDLTEYSRLYIKLTGRSGSSYYRYYIAITSDIKNSYSKIASTLCKPESTTILDISNLSGEYYIAIDCELYTKNASMSINVESIWLEP